MPFSNFPQFCEKIHYEFLLIFITSFLLLSPMVKAENNPSDTDQHINLSFKNLTLVQIFDKLESQTDFTFSYGTEVINDKRNFSYQFKQKNFSEILKDLEKGAGLRFNIVNKIVAVKVLPVSGQSLPSKENKGGPRIIKGKIVDSNSGEGLQYVVISTKDGTNSIFTDGAGNFLITVSDSVETLVVSLFGYKTMEVSVGYFERNTVLKLQEEVSELDVIEITIVRESNTKQAVLNEVRTADVVANGISQETINKTQDREASEVLRRIPGVSLMNDRFAMVRGLHPRYNSVLLNNVIAPSAETDSKAFTFDILPSSMIDRVMIYKTASPELPGDFAGGSIRLYTSSIPHENSFKVSYSSSHRPTTTFKNFQEQEQGKGAWLGYNNGKYNMPNEVPGNFNSVDQEEADRIGKKYFNKNWTPERSYNAPTDQRINISFIRRINISPKVHFGTISGVNFSQTYNHYLVARQVNIAPSTEADNNMADNIYDHSIRTGALQNFSLSLGSHSTFTLKNTYSHTGAYNYNKRSAIYSGNSQTGNSGDYIKSSGLSNFFQTLYTVQLGGTHDFSSNSHLDWTIGYSNFQRDEPDFRMSTYRGTSTEEFTPMYTPSVGAAWTRRFIYFNENSKMGSLNYQQILPFKILKKSSPKIIAGLLFDRKDRKYDLRNFGFISAQPIRFDEDDCPCFHYSAYSELIAYYLGTTIPVGRLKLSGGLRVEDYHLVLNSAYRTGVGAGGIYSIDNHLPSPLPSTNLSFNLTEKSLIRAAFSKTLNRPEFRELSVMEVYNYETNESIYGNPNLNPKISIYNYDLRYETYPNPGETFSLGIFYKRFINAIEPTFMIAPGSNPTIQIFNLPSARSIGAEVEFIKSLGNITFFKELPIIKDMDIMMNAAIINSEVEIGIGPTGAREELKRPMVGQAPYLFNTGLFYNYIPWKLSISGVYNIIGKRIARVGNYMYAQVFEMPRHSLDLTFAKQVESFEVKLGIQNVLNQHFSMVQDIDKDNKIDTSKSDRSYASYYLGPYYTLGISYKISQKK